MREAPKFVGRPGSLFSRLAESSRYLRISPRSASSPAPFAEREMRRRWASRPMTLTSTFCPGVNSFAGRRPVREARLGVRDEAGEADLEPDEDAERRDVLDLSRDDRALGHLRGEPFPGVGRGDLAEGEREAAVLLVDLADPAGDLLAGRDGRVLEVDAGRELRDVDEAVDARLDLDEDAELGVAGDRFRERGAGRDPLRRAPPTGPSRAPSWRARSASLRSRPW